jgi:hypothetical protein
MTPIDYGRRLHLDGEITELLETILQAVLARIPPQELRRGAQVRWNAGQRDRITREIRTFGGGSSLKGGVRRDVLAAATAEMAGLLSRRRFLRDQDHALLDVHPAGLVWTFVRFPRDEERRTISIFAAEPGPERPWLDMPDAGPGLRAAFDRTTDILRQWLRRPYQDQAVVLRKARGPESAHERLAAAPVLSEIDRWLPTERDGALLACRMGGAFVLADGAPRGPDARLPWRILALAPDPAGFA